MGFDVERWRGAGGSRGGATVAPPPPRRSHAMQRVQIGLAGLAAMALLIGLANIIISHAQRNQAQVVPEAAPTIAPEPVASPVSDPLADVGVVPDLPAEAEQPPGGAAAPQPQAGDAPPPGP